MRTHILVKQIDATPNIEVRLQLRVVDGRGQQRLQAIILEGGRTGQQEEVPAAAVFVLIGAEPHTEWLRDLLQRDDRAFVLTGHDVPAEAWPLHRPPLPFETSLPQIVADEVRLSHGRAYPVRLPDPKNLLSATAPTETTCQS